MEVEASYKLNEKIRWSGNITISENKILNHISYIDNWDDWSQESINYENTNLAFSPNIIWASIFNYKPKSKNIN